MREAAREATIRFFSSPAKVEALINAIGRTIVVVGAIGVTLGLVGNLVLAWPYLMAIFS